MLLFLYLNVTLILFKRNLQDIHINQSIFYYYIYKKQTV